MLAAVPVPKSNARDQVRCSSSFTHIAIVTLVRPSIVASGRPTYCPSPLSCRPPPLFPAVHVAGGGGVPGVPTCAVHASWHSLSAVTM